jgi:hypothetical protein
MKIASIFKLYFQIVIFWKTCKMWNTAVKIYTSVYIGLFQLLLFQRTIFVVVVVAGKKVSQKFFVLGVFTKAHHRPFEGQCKFSRPIPSYLFKTTFSFIVQSPNRNQYFSVYTSKRFAGISHFSMLATYPSLLSKFLSP